MKITAPYNFVPLNEKVFYPSWSEQVTQDLPFSDSEDGVIEVKIKNVSPLFTRDGALNEHSAHIMGKDGKRHYFIPGTTIKGNCVKSLKSCPLARCRRTRTSRTDGLVIVMWPTE